MYRKMFSKHLSGLSLGLIFLIIQVTTVLTRHHADEPNVCITPEGQMLCPDDMLCSVDPSGNSVCHEAGEDLPESHCLIAGRVLELRDLLKLMPQEECDVFQDDCPAGKVCCVSKKGHRCYPKHDEISNVASAVPKGPCSYTECGVDAECFHFMNNDDDNTAEPICLDEDALLDPTFNGARVYKHCPDMRAVGKFPHFDCGANPQNTCELDSDCGRSGHKCCYDGCRDSCRKIILRPFQ